MFPETPIARPCLTYVSHFCHTDSIVSITLCFQEAKFAFAKRQKHFVFPRGMEVCQNGETIMETCFQNVSGNMFPRLAGPLKACRKLVACGKVVN